MWYFEMSCYSIIRTSHSTFTSLKRLTVYVDAVNRYQQVFDRKYSSEKILM
nr:MAG TPA: NEUROPEPTIDE F F, Moniezia expansa, NPF [Caudoviricetes sp.]